LCNRPKAVYTISFRHNAPKGIFAMAKSENALGGIMAKSEKKLGTYCASSMRNGVKPPLGRLNSSKYSVV
jgi:hypothetical protein